MYGVGIRFLGLGWRWSWSCGVMVRCVLRFVRYGRLLCMGVLDGFTCGLVCIGLVGVVGFRFGSGVGRGKGCVEISFFLL